MKRNASMAPSSRKRPGAFNTGAILYPIMSSDMYSLTSKAQSNANNPFVLPCRSRIVLNPSFTILLFSLIRGTESATVAIAAKDLSFGINGCSFLSFPCNKRRERR